MSAKCIALLFAMGVVIASCHTDAIPTLTTPKEGIDEFRHARRLLDDGNLNQLAFWIALNNGNVDGMREAKANGADPEDMTEPSHYRPIHLAAAIGNLDALILLISYGVDVNAQNVNGTTALHYAARHGDVYVTKILIAASADPNLADNRGFVALHFASYANQEQFISVNSKQSGYTSISKEASTEVSITSEARSKSTIAGMGEYVGCVRALIAGGANVNAATNVKETPLYYTPPFDQYEICGLLIKAGANVNAIDEEKETPLHEAVAYGAVGVTQLLLIHNADTTAREENGLTPEEFICRCQTYVDDDTLTQCSPGKCKGDFDRRVISHLFDVALHRDS